ncbi:DDX25-like protein [Mya arenaria]|uniref:DDX25-like protein n=1 Tax=Mya arenaria TaxID=6604 RepID=A0ABY7EY42_MYAAR|nr:DDX25-like protein [Mya arenaria]
MTTVGGLNLAGASGGDKPTTSTSSTTTTTAGAQATGVQATGAQGAEGGVKGATGGAGDTGATAKAGEEEEHAVTKEDESLLHKLLHSKLVSTKADLEVLQKDPNSPLYSVKSFEALHLPTNMIAQSQSGTGKTAAFVLTMLSRVDPNLQHTQCLCLAPTYELALQIGGVTEKMAKNMLLVTRRTAHWLSEKMTKDGHAVALLSGDLDIAQRAAIINRFRDGKEKVLITTNISKNGK